jgi:DNA polymerase-3 subunit delta
MSKDSPSIGQLIKRIHANEIAPAYSLFGNESFLQDFFIQELATFFLCDSGIKKHISLDDDRQNQLLADLSAFSLFSERKLILVRQIKKLTINARKELLDYLKSPNPDTCLVLIAEEYDDRNTLQKSLKSNTILVDVRVPFPYKMKEWVSFIVKSKKYKINDGTISNLIDLYGDSIAHVVNEIEKITLMVGAETIIDDSIVEAELSAGREYHIWQLQDAIGSKDTEKSISMVKSLVENGTGIPQLIINFTNLFQQLLWYSMGVQQSTGYTGLNKIISGNLNKYSKNFHQHEIESALLVLRKSDMLTKSTSLTPLSLIEPVIINLCEGIYV